jgi:hypothetical protein
MALTFGSTNIPGSHRLIVPASHYQRQENEVFGSQGVTALIGESTAREITIDSLIYDDQADSVEDSQFPDGSSLRNFLDTFVDLGDNDTLDYDATGETYDNCEYMGYDVTGDLMPPGGTANSWWVSVKLHFKQLQQG